MNQTELISTIKQLSRQTVMTTITLLKIMIPVTIIVKIFDELGLITIIGSLLSPLMNITGLPGETGLVWATAMITNIYGGILVYISIAEENILSVAQVTVLATMILVAHSLPVEVSIARKAGVSAWFTTLFRIICAFIIGWILHIIFSTFSIFSYSSQMSWQPVKQDSDLVSWIGGQLRNYAMIFVIIFGLLLLMQILEKLGIIEKINHFFEPGLNLIGLSKKAAPITIIGMTLGLSYGGGLIITKARSDNLSDRDIFLSVSLMGLSHSLIEDTLLMMTIGASLVGLLFGRIFFTIAVIFLLAKAIKVVSKTTWFDYLYHGQ